MEQLAGSLNIDHLGHLGGLLGGALFGLLVPMYKPAPEAARTAVAAVRLETHAS